MTNLLSYCGLVDAKIRASDKDLPVPETPKLALPSRVTSNINVEAGFLSCG